MKKQTLTVVTTFNNSAYTHDCLKSLRGQPCDVLVIDDCSWDDTEKMCQQLGVEFIGRAFPRGLTYSYNLAYRIFLSRGYKFLIISNNDVIIPKGVIANMARSLASHPFLGALTRRADRTVFKSQYIEDYHEIDSTLANDAANTQQIQNEIATTTPTEIPVEHVYGFFFGVSLKIASSVYSPGYLYNPININTAQEYDLNQRTRGGHVCLDCFVFHHKGVTTGVCDIQAEDFKENRDLLSRYHGGGISRLVGLTIGKCLHQFSIIDARIRRKYAN